MILLGVGAGSIEAQEWTAERVVSHVLEQNPRVLAARLTAEAADAGAGAAESFLWPSLSATAGWTRSDDPVFAFGAKLRQDRFTEQDFALSFLNRPDALSDWQTSIRADWSILRPDRWADAGAARDRARAAQWSAEAAANEIRFHARMLFLQAVTADSRHAAALADVEARRESERVFGRRVEEGVLTRVDLLQARAERQAAEARLQASETARRDARSDLAVLLAIDATELGELVPPDGELPPLPELEARDRPELRAQDALAAAADEEAASARRVRLPRVSAFGAWNTHAPEFLEGMTSRWTGGVMLQLPIFTGFATERRIRAAESRARAAELEAEDVRRRMEADRARARRGVETARQVALSARAAEEAASQALELMGRRFQEGMATTLDLLTAQARAADFRYRSVEAESHYHIALARLEWATAQPLNDRESTR